MKIASTTTQNFQLTEDLFPKTLPEALDFIRKTESPEFRATLFIALTEPIEPDSEECNHSEDIDIRRWQFQLINSNWTLTEILQKIPVEYMDMHQLIQDFHTMARTIYQNGISELHIYNSSKFSTVFYGFKWPFDYSSDLAIAHVPEEILGICSEEAKKIGHFVEMYT